MSAKRNNGWDPLVVSTHELATVLQRWVDEFRSDHSILPNDEQAGAITLLAQSLSLDDRVITRILNEETLHTTLGLADEILQFIERPDATHNHEIHVVPNPMWSLDRWIEWYLEERRGC